MYSFGMICWDLKIMASIISMLSIRCINHVIQDTKNDVITDHCNTMSRM